MLDHAEIVADEQAGEAQIVAQLHEQIEDLRLDGHVEGGHRFIADQEFRIHCERTCNPDALALAAGELMRKSSLGARVEADLRHQIIDIVVERTGLDEAMGRRGLADDVSDSHARIEGRERILKDQLDLDRRLPGPLAPEARPIHTTVQHAAGSDFEQTGDDAAQRGLAAARFADQPDDLTFMD